MSDLQTYSREKICRTTVHSLVKKPLTEISGFFMVGGPTWTRTRDQRIMLTTSAFAACFQFVVWTVSCLYDLPVQSLHLPNMVIGLGSGLPRCKQHRLPRI